MQHYPPPGQLIDVNGYRLHLHCLGQGSPTVVLDSGFGGISLDWSLVQPELATLTRVCAYDRAGLGWSDKSSSSTSRSSQQMVTELHTLLALAQVPGPYVLVGHSLGALNARLFTQRYPDEVVGLVMVDATHEDELSSRFPAEYVQGWYAQLPALRLFTRLAQLGVMRLLVRANLLPNAVRRFFAKLPRSVQAAYRTFYAQPRSLETLISEMSAMEESYAQARAIGIQPNWLAGRPLVVLKHGRHDKLPPRASPELMRQYAQAFDAVQAELASLSSNSTLLIAEESGHNIPIDQPEAVIRAIRWVLDQVKSIPVEEAPPRLSV